MPRPGEVISEATGGTLIFWCPGCYTYHGVWTKEPNPVTGARWDWNRDFVKPSVAPSIHVKAHPSPGPGYPGIPGCHLFIREGKLQFLPDCDHHLAGQTVDMVVEVDRRAERE